MTSISSSLVLTRKPVLPSSGPSPKSLEKCIGGAGFTNLAFRPNHLMKTRGLSCRKSVRIQAGYSDSERPRGSGASIFVGGFVLGGLIVGALGCVFAPQISKALAGTDRKDLMRKLPKFIYDEEKALEKTRKILAEKIAQLNSAIDDVSSQLRSEDVPNGATSTPDEIEAAT